MSLRISQLKDNYNYCLRQAIECNKKGLFKLEVIWDDNAKETLREIETLKNAEVERRKIAQYEKI